MPSKVRADAHGMAPLNLRIGGAIRYSKTYGIYHVAQDNGSLFVRVDEGRVLFLKSEESREIFLKILEETYSQDGISIEDLDSFNRALEKDD